MLQRADVATRGAAYAAAMDASARAGDYPTTSKLFVEMTGSDWSAKPSAQPNNTEFAAAPDSRHFVALLVACARYGDSKTAQEIVDAMPLWGLTPQVEEYNALLGSSKHDLQRCMQIFEVMRRSGVQPNGSTYGEAFGAMEHLRSFSRGSPCRRRTPCTPAEGRQPLRRAATLPPARPNQTSRMST